MTGRKQIVYLFYLLLISLVVTSVSFSRYSTVFAASGTVTVARPVLECTAVGLKLNGDEVVDFDEGISLGGIMPGDVLVYDFAIKNHDGALQNEVLLKYLITILFDPDDAALPLDYSVAPKASYPQAGGGWVNMGFGAPITHEYILTVWWDEDDDDPGYVSREQTIFVQVDAQQTQA
jgi:hypothetical protein